MEESVSRREFMKKAAITGVATAGAASLPRSAFGSSSSAPEPSRRVPWVAGISQESLAMDTWEEMVERIFEIMEKAMTYRPDIICLPEAFPWSNVRKEFDLKSYDQHKHDSEIAQIKARSDA